MSYSVKVFCASAVILVVYTLTLLVIRVHDLSNDDWKNKENIAAIINCDFNNAYIGKNVEDMRALFLQCLDDYREKQ